MTRSPLAFVLGTKVEEEGKEKRGKVLGEVFSFESGVEDVSGSIWRGERWRPDGCSRAMAFEDRGRRGFGVATCYYVGLSLLGAVSLIRCLCLQRTGGFVYFQPNWNSLMIRPWVPHWSASA